jgi:hypothetical protein
VRDAAEPRHESGIRAGRQTGWNCGAGRFGNGGAICSLRFYGRVRRGQGASRKGAKSQRSRRFFSEESWKKGIDGWQARGRVRANPRERRPGGRGKVAWSGDRTTTGRGIQRTLAARVSRGLNGWACPGKMGIMREEPRPGICFQACPEA